MKHKNVFVFFALLCWDDLNSYISTSYPEFGAF